MSRIIALTGNIASGKSSAAKLLQAWGALVIDADQISRKIVEPGQEGWWLLRQNFGSEIFTPSGELNRPLLGQIIFADPLKREQLNRLLHPLIEAELQKAVADYRQNPLAPALILEIPLLFESQISCPAEEIWLVTVKPEIQLERLKQRNELSTEAALARLKAQMPQEQKLALADRVLDNSGSPEALQEQLKRLWQEIICTDQELFSGEFL